MKIITDDQGREWKIVITIGTMADIKEDLGIDLLKVEQLVGDTENTVFSTLTDDEIFVAKLISYCCDAESYERNGCTRKDFIAALCGKVYYDAREAFVQELIRFFEDMGRPYRAKIVRTWDEFMKKVIAQFNENVDSMISTNDLDSIVNAMKEAIQQPNSGK